MICSVAEFYIESYFDMTCYDNLFFYVILKSSRLCAATLSFILL